MDLTKAQLRELAVLLHGERCHAYHADQCRWLYEKFRGMHDWSGDAHIEWLDRARAFASETPSDLLHCWIDKARSLQGLRTQLHGIERRITERKIEKMKASDS